MNHQEELPERPFRGEQLWTRVGPFAVVAMLSFFVVPLPGQQAFDSGLVTTAAALNAVIFLAALALASERLPAWLDALPALAYFGVVALLRQSQGGAASGYEPLLVLPVFWLALHGTKRQLLLGIGVMAIALFAPILLLGAPEYPSAEWRPALLWTTTSLIVGLTTGSLMRTARSLSSIDELTGATNRRGLDHAVFREIYRARRSGEPLSFGMLRVTNWQLVARSSGHRTADALLRDSVALWRQKVRATDIVARYERDLFGIVLPTCTADDGRSVLERLRDLIPGGEIYTVGVTQWDGAEDQGQFVARAEADLLRVEAGRVHNETQAP